MKSNFTFRRNLLRVALLAVVLLASLAMRPQAAWATHIRAGDIQARVDTTVVGNFRRVFFKLILYTDAATTGHLEDNETLFFGDGTSSCAGTIPRASVGLVPGTTDTYVNIFYCDHTYPSGGEFTAKFVGENRVAGVKNMANSIGQTVYLQTTFFLDPALGRNHSAIFTSPAVDRAALRQLYQANPGPYDADGDSLAFKIIASRQVPLGVLGTEGPPCRNGTGSNNPVAVDCANFRLPNDASVTAASNPPLQVDSYDRFGVQTGLPVGLPFSK